MQLRNGRVLQEQVHLFAPAARCRDGSTLTDPHHGRQHAVLPQRALRMVQGLRRIAVAQRLLGLDLVVEDQLLAGEGQQSLPGPHAHRLGELQRSATLGARLLIAHQRRRDQEQDLRLLHDVVLAGQRVAEHRNVAHVRRLASIADDRLSEEAAEHDRLAIADTDVGLDFLLEFVGNLVLLAVVGQVLQLVVAHAR